MTKKLTNKDLMVGDWVYLLAPYIPEEDKEPFKVHNFMNILGRGFIIEPIPITEEILEENGIKYHCLPSDGIHSKEEYYLWDDSINLKCDYVRIKNYGKLGWEVYASGGSKNPKGYIKHNDFKGFISYVHELQHIFKICGIEKEIEI